MIKVYYFLLLFICGVYSALAADIVVPDLVKRLSSEDDNEKQTTLSMIANSVISEKKELMIHPKGTLNHIVYQNNERNLLIGLINGIASDDKNSLNRQYAIRALFQFRGEGNVDELLLKHMNVNIISVRLRVIELYAILNHDRNANVPKDKMILSLKSIIAVNNEDETKIKCCYLIGLFGKNENELSAYFEKCKHDGSKKVRIAARRSLKETADSKD